MWDFVAHIHMDPVPKGRPVRSKFSSYTPEKTVKAEKEIKDQLNIIGVRKFAEPIDVEIEIKIKRPKVIRKLVPRGDVDNYGKLVLDALNGFVIDDDRNVMNIALSKRYAVTPGYVIKIKKHVFQTEGTGWIINWVY